jgi:hypothetical protein
MGDAFTCFSFNDAASSSDYTAWNELMLSK